MRLILRDYFLFPTLSHAVSFLESVLSSKETGNGEHSMCALWKAVQKLKIEADRVILPYVRATEDFLFSHRDILHAFSSLYRFSKRSVRKKRS